MYYATAKEMEKLDKLAVKHGLEVRQMMELAGWHILSVFDRLKIPKRLKITVVCGKGNKSGDGLSAARHLINSGYNVGIVLLSKEISSDSAHHLRLLKKMSASVIFYPKEEPKAVRKINSSDILIDALIGYNLKGAPRGLFKEVIELMNQSKKRIIAYDIPSGIDSTTGKCYVPCIKAHATLTLALPKCAFKYREAKKTSGKIFLGDIGIPKFLYDKIKINSRPQFAQSPNSLISL